MKKIYFFLTMILVLSTNLVTAQSWTVYEADVLPGAFTPAFEVTQQTNPINEVIVDPDDANNNILRMATALITDNNQWRQPTTATDVTIVLKAKSADIVGKNLLFDVDIRNGTVGRFALQVRNDGTYNISSGGTGTAVLGHTPSEWTIYRITKSGQSVAVYLNEDPTPVFTATSTSTSDGTNNYVRFGDGWGSGNIDTYIDWVAWDFGGAYSPTESALPESLVPAVDNWILYEADVDPLSFVPAFEASNQSGTFSNQIAVDPDDAGNNILKMFTDVAGGNDQWRQQIAPATAVTVVFKARGNDGARPLLFDVDMDFNAFRSQIRVLPDGNLSIANGTPDAAPSQLAINTQEWNIYRFTRSGSQFALYVNEDPTPVVTGTAASAGSNNYFRFGDGWGSGTIDTFFDWAVWDLTGAYSPSDTRLPDYLTGGEVVIVPSISTVGSVAALNQDLGFAASNTVSSYTVSGSDLTANVTITPPANFEVSTDETNWSTNASPLVLAHTAGVIESTTIYVRLNASTVGDYSGDISHTSTGAETKTVAVTGSTVDLVPSLSITGTLSDFVQNLGSSSASQNYRVSGVDLKGAITVTAPTDFEVSANDTDWGASFTIDPTNRAVSNAFVYVRMSAGSLGAKSGMISHTATDATEVTQNVAGDVVGAAGITVTGTFTNFTQSLGVGSAPQSYTVSGSNLTSGIGIALPEGYEISFTGDFWLNSLTLNPLDGNVETITLYVRLNASAGGTYNGDIVHSSTGLTPVVRAVTGSTSDVTLSLGDSESALSIWPNPSTDRINLERKNFGSEGNVRLYSIEGKMINSYSFNSGSTKLEVDINSLPTGVYLIEYESEQNIVRGKFVKK